MANTYTLISSNTVSGTSTTAITFSSIPGTYTDLVLRCSVRAPSSYLQLLANSIAGTSYSGTVLQVIQVPADNSPSSTRFSNASEATLNNTSVFNAWTANTFSSVEIYIPSYTASQNKPISTWGVIEQNATDGRQGATASLIRDNAAINSLTIQQAGQIFTAGSSFYLYGIKKN